MPTELTLVPNGSAGHSKVLNSVIAEKKKSGMSNRAHGNLSQALIDFTSARDLEAEALGRNHPVTAQTNLLIAEVLDASGKKGEAQQLKQQATADIDAFAKKTENATNEISVKQGYDCICSGDYENAKKIYDSAVRCRQSVYGPQDIEVDYVVFDVECFRLYCVCLNLNL